MPLISPELTELTTTSPIAVNYSYADVADGTGTTKFNGFVLYGGTYHLATQELYSNDIEVVGTTVGTLNVFVKSLDIDFDLSTFNNPRVIKGTANFNGTFYKDSITTSNNIHGYIVIKLRKWDGTTETEIASAQSQTLTANGDENRLFSLGMTVPRTSFAKGETLRITYEGWIKITTAGNTARIWLGTDPKNRDGTYIVPSTDDPITITKLNNYIPFEIIE